jgi:hypothetical protein
LKQWLMRLSRHDLTIRSAHHAHAQASFRPGDEANRFLRAQARDVSDREMAVFAKPHLIIADH